MRIGNISFLSVPSEYVNPGRPSPLTCLVVQDGEEVVARLILEPVDLQSLARACSLRIAGLEDGREVFLNEHGVRVEGIEKNTESKVARSLGESPKERRLEDRCLHDTGFRRYVARLRDQVIGVSILHDEWSADGVLLQLTVDGCPLGKEKPSVVGWPADRFKVVLADESEIQFAKEVD